MSQSVGSDSGINSLFPRAGHFFWPAMVILGIGIYLLAKLRTGQDWDGDFALYVMNAENILRGTSYSKTPYLFNPANAINPAAYPPGLPLLFASIIFFRGVDLQALKVECLVALILFLGVYWALARKVIGNVPALAAMALMGLHPYLVDSSSSVRSEFPFLLFCYGSLLAFERLQSGPIVSRSILAGYIVLAASMASLAYLTRSIGILLFPAAIAASVWRDRHFLAPSILALILAAAICITLQFAYHADVGTYVHYFDQFSVRGLITNADRYLHVAVTMFGQGRIAIWFCKLGLLAAAIGFAARLKAPSVLECFAALYIALLIVYPISLEPARYEMPIWPLLFLYSARGLAVAMHACSPRVRQVAGAAVIAGAFMLYGGRLVQLDAGPIPYSVTDSQSLQLFSAIRRLPPGARILSRKPTIIALYTGRDSSIWPEVVTDAELKGFMRTMNLRYIVQDNPHLGVGTHDFDPLDPFIERNASELQSVFANERFRVFRLDVQPCSRAAVRPAPACMCAAATPLRACDRTVASHLGQRVAMDLRSEPIDEAQ